MLSKRLAWAAATGVLTFLLTYFWRGFLLPLAVLSALSVAVLTYSTLQASERLRRLYRR